MITSEQSVTYEKKIGEVVYVIKSESLPDTKGVNISPVVTSSMHYWLLKPSLQGVRWHEFHRVKECIQTGEIVGSYVAEEISRCLKTSDPSEGSEYKYRKREIIGETMKA